MSETWQTPNFDESAGEHSSGQPAGSASSSGGYANPYPGQGSYPGAGYDGGAGVPGVGAASAAGAGYSGYFGTRRKIDRLDLLEKQSAGKSCRFRRDRVGKTAFSDDLKDMRSSENESRQTKQ